RRGEVFVEEVAQAVGEDPARCAPMERLLETILVELQGNSPVDEPATSDAERGRAFDVAVRAPRADLRAARHGIPRRAGPLTRAAGVRPPRGIVPPVGGWSQNAPGTVR